MGYRPSRLLWWEVGLACKQDSAWRSSPSRGVGSPTASLHWAVTARGFSFWSILMLFELNTQPHSWETFIQKRVNEKR